MAARSSGCINFPVTRIPCLEPAIVPRPRPPSAPVNHGADEQFSSRMAPASCSPAICAQKNSTTTLPSRRSATAASAPAIRTDPVPGPPCLEAQEVDGMRFTATYPCRSPVRAGIATALLRRCDKAAGGSPQWRQLIAIGRCTGPSAGPEDGDGERRRGRRHRRHPVSRRALPPAPYSVRDWRGMAVKNLTARDTHISGR